MDECCYEGNIERGWGNISAQEMVHRFWLGTVIGGGYVGHGETYLHPEDILWWAKGGELHGESPARIAFLRAILEDSPPTGLEPADRYGTSKGTDFYLYYFGVRQPGQYTLKLAPDRQYHSRDHRYVGDDLYPLSRFWKPNALRGNRGQTPKQALFGAACARNLVHREYRAANYMAQSDELRLMTKVARLYHEQELTRSQIAKQLHLSQATVSRLLRRAQEAQIIRVTISVPHGAFPHLEEQVQARYGLRDVIVVECADADNPTREIGAAAAYYVETTFDQGEIIGISSWSGTLLAMVDAMNGVARRTDAQVVQILGGVGNPSAEVHAARLTGRLASLVNGTAKYLPVPGVVGSAESVRVLLDDPFVNEVYALFDRVTFGIGGYWRTHSLRLVGFEWQYLCAQRVGVVASSMAQ